MKKLSYFVQENNQTSLSTYMRLDEGILHWLKKMWDWLFDSIEKNKKDHGGVYYPYKFAEEEVKNDIPTESHIIFSVMQHNQFEKWLAKLGDMNNKNHPFHDAWNCYNQNKYFDDIGNIIIVYVSVVEPNSNKSDMLSIAFGKHDEKESSINVTDIFWNSLLEKKQKIDYSYKEDVLCLLSNFINSYYKDIIDKVVMTCEI